VSEAPRQPSVAVLTEVTGLDRSFDYEVGEGFDGPLEPGSRVRVPLHGRSVRGWVLGPGESPAEPVELKPLRSSLGVGPPEEVVALARWAAWRWYSHPARFLATGSPATIVRRLPARPAPSGLEVPAGSLGQLGRTRALQPEHGVLRLAPAIDPFELVVGFLAGLAERGRLAEGSALILVPGVGYSARLVARLARRGIPAVEAAGSWEAARAGWPVVVGSRSAALAPIPKLAGVLVLDVEDDRFRSEAAPTWWAPALAAERARRAEAPALFVASCPSALESSLGEPLEIAASAERDGWPTVAVVDPREEDPRASILSARLVELARDALERQVDGVAVACVVNRTGRARLLACARCATVVRCEHCDAAMVLDDELRCPRCESRRPAICQACGATKLKLLRLGTAQLAPELEVLLGVAVAELTASSPEGVERGARAVVGTEAVLHRLRRCALVAFLDFDHHLLAPRVGAELDALGALGRAGRLVGPRHAPGSGTVLVQTRLAEHPVLLAAQRGAPTAVLEADAELRRSLRLPPFRALAKVRGEGAAAFVAQLDPAAAEVAELEDGAFAVLAADPSALADLLAGVERPRGKVVVAVDLETI
jgi:primosomal protein N' (replication factor Y)